MTLPVMAALALLAVGGPQASPPVNADAQVQKAFADRVASYVQLRNTIEGKLPPLSEEAEPGAITAHQQTLLASLRRARSDARQGDIFDTGVRRLIRRLIAGALSQEGAAPRQAMREENPGTIPLRVNGAFPTAVPLPTVPPQVLLALPRLPDDELEYRIVGTRLLLLDPRANMVVDYMDRALPE